MLPPDGRVQTTPYHMPVEDFIGHELVAELERTSRIIAARKAAIAAWNARVAGAEAGDRADAGEVRDFASR